MPGTVATRFTTETRLMEGEERIFRLPLEPRTQSLVPNLTARGVPAVLYFRVPRAQRVQCPPTIGTGGCGDALHSAYRLASAVC